jgi:hypothetical protein
MDEDMTDDEIRDRHLADIYAAAEPDALDWIDPPDFDPEEGEHELVGDADLDREVDLVYPEEDEDDDDKLTDDD